MTSSKIPSSECIIYGRYVEFALNLRWIFVEFLYLLIYLTKLKYICATHSLRPHIALQARSRSPAIASNQQRASRQDECKQWVTTLPLTLTLNRSITVNRALRQNIACNNSLSTWTLPLAMWYEGESDCPSESASGGKARTYLEEYY